MGVPEKNAKFFGGVFEKTLEQSFKKHFFENVRWSLLNK